MRLRIILQFWYRLLRQLQLKAVQKLFDYNIFDPINTKTTKFLFFYFTFSCKPEIENADTV